MAIVTYKYECGGNVINFNPNTQFWITDTSGIDGLDVTINETQSAGQIGTQHSASLVSSRPVTLSGFIKGDFESSQRELNNAIRPFAKARLYLTASNGVEWYLEGEAKTMPDYGIKAGILPFQFSFHAFYPYWQTSDIAQTLLGGLNSAWFPTPVSTSGSWYISQNKDTLDTDVINLGNGEVAFELSILANAEVINPRLYNLNTQTFLELKRTMHTGERAVISTKPGNRGCIYYYADGQSENAFRYMDIQSDFAMVLSPGSNNMRFTAEEGRNNAKAVLTAPRGASANV